MRGMPSHGVHSDSSKSDINLSAATDKASYAPGEAMSVTVNGGYRGGWVRAILYDDNGAELARSSGPGGTGSGSSFPIVLSANAPTTPGTYTYTASWYGNQYDKAGAAFGNWVPDPTNPNHGEERVATNSFDVIGGPPPVPDITVTDSVAPAADLSISFGAVVVGNSATQTITIKNDGGADLVLGSVAQPSPPFGVAADNCSGQTLAPAGGCGLTVTFSHSSADAFSGSLGIPSNDPDENPVTVSLSGTGLMAGANNPPSKPDLIYPAMGQEGLQSDVTFTWSKCSDPEGDPVTYMFYLDTDPSFPGTVPVEVSASGPARLAMAGLGGLMVFGIMLAPAAGRKRKIALLIPALLAAAVFLASCGGNGGATSEPGVSYTATGLSPGTTYYWKVVATDANGASSESDVRSFTTGD